MVDKPASRMKLEAIAFIVGIAVLVLEIAGARLLAPAYGTSIFVWTAQICVVLVALSAGYYYGGKRSEKEDGMEIVSKMLLYAGFTLAISLFLANIMLPASTLLGSRFGPFLFSAFLFFLPCFFAGSITPLLLRLYVGQIGSVGNDAGRIYAISTVGSLAGALLSAYFIVPFVGARAGIFITAAAFVLLGFAAKKHDALFKIAACMLVLSSSYALLYDTHTSLPDGFEIKKSYDSEYFHIRIVENKTEKFLVLDSDFHSASPIGGKGLVFGYTVWMANATEEFFAAQGRDAAQASVGQMGLGAGSLAGHFAKLGANVDVFEIDPAVYKTAKDEFGLEDARNLKVHVGDARAMLSERDYAFDALLIDVYSSKISIPVHLATKEAFGKYSDALSGDGLLAVNVISAIEGKKSAVFRAISSTAREDFPHQMAVHANIGRSGVQNVVLLASKKPFPDDFSKRLAGKGIAVEAEWENGDIFTDERSTADYAMMRLLE